MRLTREIICCLHRGRVGLALSGGGLCAAFTHLGLLARLAECDVLRSVEVRVCVSASDFFVCVCVCIDVCVIR